jgi:hypothetical protein
MASPTTSHPAYSGACHCGAVHITIAHKPDYLNDCNCSLCTKHAVLWGYYDPAEVSISGETRPYIRADLPEPAIALHFCDTCACITHWLLLETFADAHRDMPPRMGINIRLFAEEAVEGVEVRFPDGRSW